MKASATVRAPQWATAVPLGRRGLCDHGLSTISELLQLTDSLRAKPSASSDGAGSKYVKSVQRALLYRDPAWDLRAVARDRWLERRLNLTTLQAQLKLAIGL